MDQLMLTKGNTAVFVRHQLQTQRGEGPRRAGVCPCQPSPSAHGCHLWPSKITRCVSVCWLVLCGVQTTAALWGTDNSCFVGYRQQLLLFCGVQTTATFTLGCTDNSYFVVYRQQLLLLCGVQTTATLWVTLTDNSCFVVYRQQLLLLCGVQTTATFTL